MARCLASYRPTSADRVGRVMPCPEPECGAQVPVVVDVIEGPAFDSHAYVPKTGRPRGHHRSCLGADGKVEDCRCPEWVAA